MKFRAFRIPVLVLACVPAVWPVTARAQATTADYERALGLREKYQYLALGLADAAAWIDKSSRFVYRRSVADGHEFVVMDAATLERKPAFDHARLAAALSKAAGRTYTATRLPFNTFTLTLNEQSLRFSIGQIRWSCSLVENTCDSEPPPATRPGTLRGFDGPVRDPDARRATQPQPSPDGKWEAVVQNFNLAIRPKGGGKLTALSADGSEGNYYDLQSVAWSPDSKQVAAHRVRPGYRRLVHYVESSPEDQVQPRHWTLQYAKPGDVVDLEQPVLFGIDPVRQLDVSNELFPNPYQLSPLVWRKDSRAVTFEYNQRGHQVYRVIEVDAASGRARAVVSEEPKTFFYYGAASSNRSAGKRFRHDVADGREVVWMSERDGWNHLYLCDGATGEVKNQITQGAWAVRGVEKVDEEKRQIWFSANGMEAGKDPYFLHYFRVNFDGTGLTRLTNADADHEVRFSADMQYYVDTYSRVDLPTVLELRRAADGSLVRQVERGDITALVAAGWKPPEVFVAKGRDGTTDIWGVIFRPTHFDSQRKYPVVESIYAGPHGSFVPKTFSAYSALQAQAEVGFIVVQIDGMGTSNRSKAFHDVAWKSLGDAGFPDRILWHRAVAAKYSAYEITRVGIYGGSAGGQSAMGGLLFHPEFYKAAVAYAGCHDNRMDKIWWNEQWMGWPIGPQYSASSNVDNASRLQGKLLLVVGELDTNVDPSSTLQVASALVHAGKTFDLLVIPGAGHAAGRSDEHAAYGERKRFDFFVQHLLGHAPPDWNRAVTATPPQPDGVRIAAIVAEQERIAREFKDSALSPFSAVASRYFTSGESARVVVGADGVAFAAPAAAGGVADVSFDGNAIWVAPVPGSPALTLRAKRGEGNVETSGGRPVEGRTRLGAEDVVAFGRYYLETGAAAGTGRAIVYDPDAALRKSYTGLRWFPATLAFQLRASYAPIPNPNRITVGTSRGLQKEYFRVGTLSFEVDGKPSRLVALATSPAPKAGDQLFIPFRDLTTGRESYAVGRYLNVTFQGPKAEYLLDFNLATNPYCNYSPHYNCVIPPRENTLGVAIRAGEMIYGTPHS